MAPPDPDRFPACLAFTWLAANDGQPLHTTPGDRGGATSWGVTLASYSDWRASQGITRTTVWDLASATKDQLSKLVRARYWDAVHGDDLPPGVDLAVFDFGYMSGSGRSVQLLQEVLGVAADGSLGPHTLAAVHAADPADLVRRLGARHQAFYASLADYERFGRGWTTRNAARVKAALAMIAATHTATLTT